MEQKIKIFIVIFLAIILQVSFFPGLTDGKIIPDLVLVLIILWSSKKNFEDIWLGIFFSGILLDFLVFDKMGINTISFIIISFAASFLQKRFFIAQRLSSFFVILAIVIGGTIFNSLLTNFLVDFSVNVSLGWLGMKIAINVVIAIFLYSIMSKFKKFFRIKEENLLVN